MEKRESRRRFDASFKRESVRLATETGSDSKIEKDLGLYPGAIRNWRKELEADPDFAFPGVGHLKPLEEENRRLRQENRVLREERDILKKATAIFSRTPQ